MELEICTKTLQNFILGEEFPLSTLCKSIVKQEKKKKGKRKKKKTEPKRMGWFISKFWFFFLHAWAKQSSNVILENGKAVFYISNAMLSDLVYFSW